MADDNHTRIKSWRIDECSAVTELRYKCGISTQIIINLIIQTKEGGELQKNTLYSLISAIEAEIK